jgi:hypothetical protein
MFRLGGWPQTSILFPKASHIAGITGLYYYAWLIGWDGVLLTFYVVWHQTIIVLIFTSLIAPISSPFERKQFLWNYSWNAIFNAYMLFALSPSSHHSRIKKTWKQWPSYSSFFPKMYPIMWINCSLYNNAQKSALQQPCYSIYKYFLPDLEPMLRHGNINVKKMQEVLTCQGRNV